MRLEIPEEMFAGGDECAFTFESIQQVMENQSHKLLLNFKGIATFVFQNDEICLDLDEMLPKLKKAFNAFFKFTESRYECSQIAFCLPHGPLIFIKKLPETIFENVSE